MFKVMAEVLALGDNASNSQSQAQRKLQASPDAFDFTNAEVLTGLLQKAQSALTAAAAAGQVDIDDVGTVLPANIEVGRHYQWLQ
jgi:hypothetical protein